MASLSQAWEKKLLEFMVGKTAAPSLPVVWVGIAIEAPTSASTGTTFKDAKYTSYKRVEVKGAQWEAAVEGSPSEIINKEEIKFPESTGGESSKVGWAGIFTAETGGEMIAWGALGSEKTIEKEATPSIAAKTLKFTLS